jgi:hypothetical protein
MRSLERVGTLGVLALLVATGGCRITVGSGDGDDEGLQSRRTATGGGATVTVEEGGEGGSGGVEAAAGGAGGESGSGVVAFSLTSVTILSSARSGEVALSGQLGIAEGELAFVLSAIKDPEDATKPADPGHVGFTVTMDGEALECEVGPTSDLQQAPVDIVFINDTTASMSGTVNGIADSVSEFATSVADRGVDARFAMVTYGDEFSTLSSSEDAYTIGQGDYVATGVDSHSRAYVDLTELENFQAFLEEVKDSDDLGSGGGDSPENTLGALAYALDKMEWRSGAARVFIVIGDNPSHTSDPDDSLAESLDEHFLPPPVEDILASLDGTAVVHVVGRDRGEEPYYNLKGLSDATGGAFIDLPSDGVVDLTSMALNNWVGTTYFGVCFGVQPGERTMRIATTVTGEAEHEGVVRYDLRLE